MKTQDRIIEKLFLVAYDGVSVNNLTELAGIVGESYAGIHAALREVRSPEWIELHGWTIPYVPKGRGRKVYKVADSSLQLPELADGRKRKISETETHLRNAHGHGALEVAFTDGRTLDGRKARLMAKHLTRLVEDLDECVAA